MTKRRKRRRRRAEQSRRGRPQSERPRLEIACSGADTVELDKLRPFQGELKTLSDEARAKLRGRLENGFRFPFHLWRSPDGTLYILDGHQRLQVLQDMKEDGWIIPPLPVVWVEADSEESAKMAVLEAASQFGRITHQGLGAFLEEADLQPARVAAEIEFAEVDFLSFDEEQPERSRDGAVRANEVPEEETLLWLWIEAPDESVFTRISQALGSEDGPSARLSAEKLLALLNGGK